MGNEQLDVKSTLRDNDLQGDPGSLTHYSFPTLRTVKPRVSLSTTPRIDPPASGSYQELIDSVSRSRLDTDIVANAGASFAQISFQIDPKESIEFFHEKGGTVWEKAILVRRDLARFFDQQIALNQQKISALEEESVFKLAELEH